MSGDATVAAVKNAALWFESGREGLTALVDAIGPARLVLIGGASHGTDEFYRIRADLTAALIERRGFNFVATEADWPEAYRVNRWVRLASDDPDARSALGGFSRFPDWMWRNDVVLDFLTWLRAYNATRDAQKRVGFYGLDRYSLHTSMEAVLTHLERIDPDDARRARERYACFEDSGGAPQGAGDAAGPGLSRSCEDEVVAQLVDLRTREVEHASRDGDAGEGEGFFAEKDASLVRHAEDYYRSMFRGRADAWNLRDTHMMETLEALIQWTHTRINKVKAVVWAHNLHVGDARATEMGKWGGLSLGQLVREKYEQDARLIGFSTYGGTVTAARSWGEPVERFQVRPSIDESYERVFHAAGFKRFLLRLDEEPSRTALMTPRLERAIGAVYKPEVERACHYFRARLPDQFDILIHVDKTKALNSLEQVSLEEADAPDTYPAACDQGR